MNSSKFMLFLVNDLLDFFQIKNKKFKKNLKWVDINASIRDLIEMFGVGAREKGIGLIYESPNDFPSLLYVDEQRIKQVILNLLQNALKFTFEGLIKVNVGYVSNEVGTKELKVSVSDTGIGISEEDSKKLFRLFGKLETSSSLNTSGIGLGLSICKQIIEVFDGKIYFDEEYKDGAKFTFQIPAENDFDSNAFAINEVLL